MERSRALPYLRVITRFLPTSASSTRQAAMYPSCWRISAMCDLILEYGMPTVSWYAELALRRRVSMSAIGSVIDMAVLAFLAVVSLLARRASRDLRRVDVYQLDFVMPGSSPRCAIVRKQIRHRPNFR